MNVLASIPSPSQGVWELGPFPLRAYALCIIAGIVAAAWLTEKRWIARGGAPGDVLDIAVWAVPAGIIGARIYHVITSPGKYFGRVHVVLQVLSNFLFFLLFALWGLSNRHEPHMLSVKRAFETMSS